MLVMRMQLSTSCILRLLNKCSRTVVNVSIRASIQHVKMDRASVMDGAPWAVQRRALDGGGE